MTSRAAVVLVLGFSGSLALAADRQAKPQPAAAARQVRVPFKLATVVECEALLSKAVVSAGPAEVQVMQGFGDQWGGSAQVFWRPPAPVNEPIRSWPNLRLYPKIDKTGKYRVALVHTVAPDYGTFRVFLRGTPVKDCNAYAAGVEARRVELGDFQLQAGTAEFVFTVFEKDAQSSDYFVGLDRIEFLPMN
jgi:hypothetical protein